MSVSTRKHNRNALALVVLFALYAEAAAGGDHASIGAENYAARGKQILATLYPGLGGRLSIVVIGNHLRDGSIGRPDLMNFFTMDLYANPPESDQRCAACWCSDRVVTAQLAFDWQTKDKELYDLSVSGPAIYDRRNSFADEVDRHPDWSDARITAALNEAGAKYGPDRKAEFLRALPLEELKPFIGGELKLTSVEFYVRLGTSGTTKAAGLTWLVRARWHSPDGREADCTMAFEPFEGMLTMLKRDPVEPTRPAEISGEGAKQKP